MADSASGLAIYLFGSYRLDPLRRTLTRAGTAVNLTPRMFDTLMCLAQHAGETVDRNDLIRAVWRDRVVDEANLKQTIYALRKVLETGTEERLIRTVPMRGYSLAVQVQMEAGLPAAPAFTPVSIRQRLRNMIGGKNVGRAAALMAASAAITLVLRLHDPAPPVHTAGHFGTDMSSRPAAPPIAVLPLSDAAGKPAQIGQTQDLASAGTSKPGAFDAYLRGMKLARDSDDLNVQRTALKAFESAIAIDPNFAAAHANRAREMAIITSRLGNVDPAEIERRLGDAMAEADRAVVLAPRLGATHLARYDILMTTQDFPGALREMQLARSYAPGDFQVLMEYVFLQVSFGHPSLGLEAAERAVNLNPLAPDAYLALAWAQRALRDYDAALASLHRAKFLGADINTVMFEATIALERGDNRSAQLACAHIPHWQDYLCLAIAEHRLGHTGEGLKYLAALRAALGESGAYQYAEVYAQWSEKSEAVKWLQAAYRLHDTGLMHLRSDRFLDPIRHTPQYADIEKQLQFPP